MTLPLQLHIGSWNGEGPVKPLIRPISRKPLGGFWTSTYCKRNISDWVEWCVENNFGDPLAPRWLVTPRPDANINIIRHCRDWDYFAMEFGRDRDMGHFDWAAVAQQYDALHMSRLAVNQRRLDLFYDTYAWDVESTVWFKRAAFTIEPLAEGLTQ